MAEVTIALDAMGGDYGPSALVPAALTALKQNKNLRIILVGDETTLHQHLTALRVDSHPRLRIQHASEVVGSDEPPAQALRFKKDSSMRVAINLVKQCDADACVSAGNTGALMATAKFVLKTLPGIDRPAISALLPTIKENSNVRVLDLGANVDSSAKQLLQFAVMGSVLASSVGNKANPVVGMVNIGSEEIKGTQTVKEAGKLLAQIDAINYIGFIEGDDIYKGVADIVICDGFVGNVALKTSEGLAKLMYHLIKVAFKKNLLTRLIAIAAWPILKGPARRLDPARYNGASLVGLQGTVIKSHGSATSFALVNAINEAYMEVLKNVPQRISSEVANILATIQEPEEVMQ